MEDLTGRQFGPYQIVAPLGEGGMAAVYKAYQPAMERYVALKVLPRQLAGDPQFVARFQREAKLLAQLQHPHILPVFDFGEAEGYSYLVMPYISSGTLTAQLLGQPLPWPRIRQIAAQIGEALDYAHARGLVHRDVKPSNVLLDERGNCLLTDFGLARMVEASVNLTTSGAIMGTPAYMSPEQGSGQPIDGRSDIYSLGVILYELVTGRVPYKAETPIAVIFKHIQDPLPPARSLNPELPESLELVILKALAKSPSDRYQTAGELVRAVQTALPDGATTFIGPPLTVTAPVTQVAQSTRMPTRAPESEQAEKRRRVVPIWAWLIGGAVLIGVVIGLGALLSDGAIIPPNSPAQTATRASLPAAASSPTRAVSTSAPSATRVPPLPTRTALPPTATRLPPTRTALPPTATRLPPTRTRVPPTATPGDSASTSTDWAVDFTLAFPPNFWSVGLHQYTLVSECSILPDSNQSWTQSFEVSDSTPERLGDIFLRLSGLRYEGQPVNTIHPAEATVAQLTQIEITQAQAQAIVEVCRVTLSWDGGPAQPLQVGSPYQQR